MTASEPAAESNSVWRRLWSYARRHRVLLALVLGLSPLSMVLTAVVPLISQHIVDEVIIARTSDMAPWIAVFVLAAALTYVLTFVRQYCGGRLAADVLYDLRRDLFGSVVHWDGRDRDRAQSGQLFERAAHDVDRVHEWAFLWSLTAGNALYVATATVAMFALSPVLTLVVLVTLPAIRLASRVLGRPLGQVASEAHTRAAAVVGVVEAAVAGVRVVKGFSQETREIDKLARVGRALAVAKIELAKVLSRYMSIGGAVMVLAQVGVLAVGGLLVIQDEITLGVFVAFCAYVTQLIPYTQMLLSFVVQSVPAKLAAERVMNLIDHRPAVADSVDAVSLVGDRAPLVEFDQVSFGYEPATPVLRGVTLRVEAGETLVVLGESGSGKSTLVQLLQRCYDVSEGALRLDGHDVRDVRLESLRCLVSVVEQEPSLMSGTIRQNIAMGDPHAKESDVLAAARVARVDDFVQSLPHAYDTFVGEHGVTLSGGQRQRVALARAVLANPRLLVLDDATASLDAHTESQVLTAWAEMAASRTTVLFTHRPAMLALADRIAVLAQGTIEDIGTHHELMSRCAQYRRLVAVRPPAVSRSAARLGRPVVPRYRALTDDDSAGADPTLRNRLMGLGRSVIVSVAVLIAVLGMSLALPSLFRLGIDHGVQPADQSVLWFVVVVCVGVVVIEALLRIYQAQLTARIVERTRHALRMQVFTCLQRLGLDFYERERAGRIVSRAATDVDRIAEVFEGGALSGVVSVLTLAGVLTAILAMDVAMVLAVVWSVPVVVACMIVFWRRSSRSYRAARHAEAQVMAALHEHAAHLRTIQAFRHEESSRVRFAEHCDDHRLSVVRTRFLAALTFPFLTFLSSLTTAVVLVVANSLIRADALTLGTLVACLLYVRLLFAPIQQVTLGFDGYQEASASVDRIRELLRTPVIPAAPERPREITSLMGHVELRDVHYTYPNGLATTVVEAITGISLIIPAGQTVAVVGASGAGKSTLVRLLARFDDPTMGTILVDGIELTSCRPTRYRRWVGLVSQEPFLFAGTVGENIAYGMPEAASHQIEAAARAVGAHEVLVALPGGYAYRVAERGCNLSAGQRQLIALARVQLTDPALLLLDEATAAMDPDMERVIAASLRRLSEQRTTIVIAHRLTAAVEADRILVMADGRIVEDGTHGELLDMGGLYGSLWRRWQSSTPIAS